MNFDPCGTRTLDGEEIINRLAKALTVPSRQLRQALATLVFDRMDIKSHL